MIWAYSYFIIGLQKSFQPVKATNLCSPDSSSVSGAQVIWGQPEDCDSVNQGRESVSLKIPGLILMPQPYRDLLHRISVR